ncbi:MAG: alpha/beta hydrolase [Anaerolineae bacterium]|nr:alpha/beta hydrolase [Anaerolineae bacterium]
MLQEKNFHTGVVEISYAEGSPAGPPLLLLHGFAGRWQGFLPLLPVLSLGWHVYAPDLRGHGKSGRVVGRYGAEDYLADIEAFVRGVMEAPAVVFGHSLGALFALALAGRQPEHVRAVIVGDMAVTPATWAAITTNQEFHASLRDLAAKKLSIPELTRLLADLTVPRTDPPVRYKDSPDVLSVELREWAKSISQLDPDVLALHAQGRRDELMQAFDFERMLRRVSCPTLLLQADPSQGGIMTDHDVEYAMSLLAEAYHVQIEDAGHDLGLATCEVGPLMRAVLNFLESL